MAASTVTGRTSVVLVSSPQSKVFLSSVGYPGHIVTIQDVGGLASQGDPIVISTTNGIFFADGSISTLLVDPYSYLTVASRSATSWQILNNIGYLTTLSNAFINTLTAGNAYTKITSTVKDTVSTSVAQNVTVTNSLTLLGNVDILGNITINGTVDLFSTMNVNENVRFSSGLIVQGAVTLQSTLALREELIVGGFISTLNDVSIGEDLYVGSSLSVRATLLPKNLSVQTLTMNTINLGGGLLTAEGISVGCNAYIGGSLNVLSSMLAQSSITILGDTLITSTLSVQNDMTTRSFESLSSGTILKEARVGGLEVTRVLSTPNSLFVAGTLESATQTNVESVVVTGKVTTSSLLVNGNAEISSMRVDGGMSILGSAFLTEMLHTSSLSAGPTTVERSLYVSQETTVGGTFSTLTGVSVEKNLSVQSTLNVKQDASALNVQGVSTLAVYGNVSTTSADIAGDLLVHGNFSIPGLATLNALGAPIEISLSTLTLSNTMTVLTTANIPIFTSISNVTFPNSTEVGSDTGFGGFLKSQVANIRGSLQDYNPNGDGKAVSTTRISTLTGVNLLSTFRVGSSNLTLPLLDASGLLLFGSNINQSNVYTLTPIDYSVKNTSLQFSTIAYGGSFNSSNSLWVTVGQNSNQEGTLQYSTDKARTWQQAVTGGFAPNPLSNPTSQAGIGRDVIYMSTTYQNATPPVWVATGRGVNIFPSVDQYSLQYSTDGSNWQNATGTVFPTSTQGGNRLCLHRFSVASNGAVLLAAGDMGSGNLGILYSQTGTSWNQATSFGPVTFNATDITVGLSNALYAVGTVSGFGPPSQGLFTATECNYATGWCNISSNLSLGGGTIQSNMTTFNTIAYGNNMYVIGGIPTGSNSNFSIYYSPTLGGWQPISQGGFTGGVQRIVFNDFYGVFFAVGSNTGGTNLQISPNGSSWQPIPNTTFPSRLYSVALGDGQISLPDPVSRFFTVNVESRFQTGVSSLSLITSTIAASSFTAQVYDGPASQISNLTNFGSAMNVSSILTENVFYGSTLYYGGSTNMNLLSTNFGYLIAGTFLSTVKQTIATGLDSLANGNIQLTGNVTDWVRASNANFQYYASEVVGDNNLFNPLFVATGADSLANKSIQYSTDGYTWNPVESGGFTINDADGYKSGNTVVAHYYQSTILTPPYYVLRGPRYVVGGNAQGSQSTIFYSDDGSNFASASNSSVLLNSISKIKSANTFALALNSSNYIVNSSNGIEWNQTNSPQFTAFTFGFTPSVGFTWVALDSVGQYYISYDSGSNWSYHSDTYIFNAFDMIYASNSGVEQFYAVSPTALYSRSSNSPYPWNVVLSPFSVGATSFTSLYWSETELQWFLGAQAAAATSTIFTASLTGNFAGIATGGFSSGTVLVGAGYGVAISSFLVLTGGTGAFTSLTATKPQILRLDGAAFPPTPSISTVALLSQQNASNVFRTSVYGLAIASSIQTYPYVGVGDGVIPQKTIGRSSNLSDWIPAVTGGFSPAGYGVTYYENSTTGSNLWLAVGKAAASTATIQYSEDAANWFATNHSPGIPFGGRGIAQISSLGRLVVVGEAPGTPNTGGDRRTIVYSDDGYTWSNVNTANGFNYAGYGIAEGYIPNLTQTGLIAVGKPYGADPSTLDRLASIQYSTDGLGWGSVTTGGFSVAGYGVAYGRDYMGAEKWVAVGDDGQGGVSNIQYSVDGVNWTGVSSYPFFDVGYGVAFNREKNVFVAVGKTTDSQLTILYSGNGSSWFTLTSGGFQSQQSFGTANAFYSQQINRFERLPFLQFPKFVVYERSEPFNYNLPSLRVQSTLATFNEVLSVNLSSQVMINTTTPQSNYTVTVNGDIVTSTFVYKGAEPSYRSILVSSFTVSTLQINQFLGGNNLTTPSLGIHTSNLANTMTSIKVGPSQILYTNINDTLYSSQYNLDTWGVGINTSNPAAQLDVVDTVATSSLTTSVYIQTSQINLQPPNQVFLNSSNLAMFTGANPVSITGKNTIYSEVSSLTFNNCLTVNLSSQRVGLYTTNPQFEFDARTEGWLQSLSTQTVNTGTLFFTLQSL